MADICTQCGLELPDSPPGERESCPDCGGSRRSVEAALDLEALASFAPRRDEGFLDQVGRLQRYWLRLQLENEWPQMLPDEHLDTFYSFFQNCHHLKDWIKNDPEVSQATRDAVEDFITNDEYLSLCADIANATKHLSLARTKRSSKDPFLTSKLVIRSRGPRRVVRFLVAAKGSPEMDALDLARECLGAWHKFLAGHDLMNAPIAFSLPSQMGGLP